MGELLDTICDEDNLWAAWSQVARKNSAPGVDGERVEDFSRRLKSNLQMLQRALRRGTYRPRPLRGVQIPKRRGGWRQVGVPCVRDRIAQRA